MADIISGGDPARALDLGVDAQAVVRSADDAEHGGTDGQPASEELLLAQVRQVEHEVGTRLLQTAGAVGGIVLPTRGGVQSLPGDEVDRRVESTMPPTA